MTPREQAERALVGCILEDAELVQDLKAEWFDDLRLGHFVMTAELLQSEGKPVDITTVAHSETDPDCIALLRECQQECHSPANFSYWLGTVLELVEKDRLRAAANRFLAALPGANGDLVSIVSELENALAKQSATGAHTLTGRSTANLMTDDLERREKLKGDYSGIESGFIDLDRILDGFQSGEVVIVGSRPSVGKTAIACNIVDRVCFQNRIPTLFISLEMSAPALARRLLSHRTGIEMNRLRRGKFFEGDTAKMTAFAGLIASSPLYIREGFGGMAASQAAALIRRGAKRKQVRFVVLDYLQKLRPDNRHEKRTYEVAEASGMITAAVKDTGVAFLCLAQLNRESEKDKGRRPRMSDLADSGQIERDADTVILLHRDKSNPNSAELIVSKQRDGETGSIHLNFDGAHCRFQTTTKPGQNENA